MHHLTQLSKIGQGYEVDPVNDLRPVCPNCHAMLHKRNPPYAIDKLEVKRCLGWDSTSESQHIEAQNVGLQKR